jgi:hypothetical protein
LKHLTIDRKVWARGPGDNFLLNPKNGRQCCVGIYLSSLGMEDAALALVETAAWVTGTLPDEANWLLQRLPHTWVSKIAEKLYAENDREQNEEDRERQIAALFAEQGIEVEFVGSNIERK